MTKLPRPCPQYPPFTLGNGFYGSPISGSWRFQRNQRWSQALRGAARAFDVILLTDRTEEKIPSPARFRRQSLRPCLGRLLPLQPRTVGET